MAVGPGIDGYGQRLLELQSGAQLPPDVDALVGSSAALRAHLLEVASDRELLAKMTVALTRNRADAELVLMNYGADPTFRDLLRRYGEGVVPLVAYFMKHDIGTLRALYGWQRLLDTWRRRCAGWHLPGCKAEPPEAPIYDGRTRGLHAIERLRNDGYDFMGQFDVNSDGIARWNQTERILESTEAFLLSGFRNLERKYDTGQPIGALDIAEAGVDAIVLLGGARLLKLLRISILTDEVVAAERAAKQATRVLKNDRRFPWVGEAGPRTQMAYLIARHPSLLTGLFADTAKRLKTNALFAAALGWWIVAMGLSLILLPVLRIVLAVLIRGLLGLRWLACWLHGDAVRRKDDSPRTLFARRASVGSMATKP
jgi:hypothetical protein